MEEVITRVVWSDFRVRRAWKAIFGRIYDCNATQQASINQWVLEWLTQNRGDLSLLGVCVTRRRRQQPRGLLGNDSKPTSSSRERDDFSSKALALAVELRIDGLEPDWVRLFSLSYFPRRNFQRYLMISKRIRTDVFRLVRYQVL